MVYAIENDYASVTSINFVNNEDWFHNKLSAGKGPGYAPPDETPIIACMSVDPLIPDAPPSMTGAAYVFFGDEKFKDIIEALEPGVHDFVPMELRYGTPEEFETFPYYLVRPQQSFNPIDLEASDLKWFGKNSEHWRKKLGVPFTLRTELTEGRHLWSYDVTFISDAVHDAIQKQGLVIGWALEKQLESTALTTVG